MRNSKSCCPCFSSDMERVLEMIDKLHREAPLLSGGLFELEEYILLPHYGGNVMLRFRLNSGNVTKDGLDGLEKELYSLVPDGFLADFMGEVYRKAGCGFDRFEEKLIACAERYREVVVPESPFCEEVRSEAARVLAICGLPADARVWEIQPDEDGTAVLILGEENGKLKEVQADGISYEVLSVRETPCEGLMKAAVFAREKGICLMRAAEEE